MERRPATTSVRTRSLLIGLCLVWIIGSIRATGKISIAIVGLSVTDSFDPYDSSRSENTISIGFRVFFLENGCKFENLFYPPIADNSYCCVVNDDY